MRRHEYFILAWGAVLLGLMLLVFKSVSSIETAPISSVEPPAFYRLQVGDFVVTVLWDGTTARQFDPMLSKPAVIREMYVRDRQDLPAQMSINTFLVNIGPKLVLVDTGGGGYVGPRAARLLANMRASGYLPEQVDAILITHMHPDHVRGLVDSDRRVFPNALVHFDRRDLDFWRGPGPEETPRARQVMFDHARNSLQTYSAAGMLRPFQGATDLYPGIRALPAPGHTGGHTAYRFESRGKALLLWGDILHPAETQFFDPEISIQFDKISPMQANSSPIEEVNTLLPARNARHVGQTAGDAEYPPHIGRTGTLVRLNTAANHALQLPFSLTQRGDRRGNALATRLISGARFSSYVGNDAEGDSGHDELTCSCSG